MQCGVEVAPIRAEPRDDAEQVTQALAGEPLEVEERREGWARVRTSYGYPGWIRDDALAHGRGVLPPPRAGEPLAEARSYLGTTYLWGGLTERGIDCSGLVHMSHRRLGRLVPRDADQQEEAARKLTPDELRVGDLITYGDDGREGATHVAFWAGDGRILHATEREGVNGVVEEPEPPDLARRRRFLCRF